MALTPRGITVTGGEPTFDTATHPAGDTIPGWAVSTGRCMVLAANPTGSPITVTMVDPGVTPGGQPNPDPTYEVPAADNGAPGLAEWFVPISFIDPSTGDVKLTYSDPGLTLAVRTV